MNNIIINIGVLLLVGFIALSSCEKAPDFIGNVYEVGCGNAATMEIEGQLFDFRPANSCGNGLFTYNRDVVSESGDITAEFSISCSVGFCIGNVTILSWEEN